MLTIHPYLNFLGKTEDAFNFYKSVFGGEFSMLSRFSDTPFSDQVPEADRNKIMHIALPIGNGIHLMGTDIVESMGQTMTVGSNVHLTIMTHSEDEAKRIFAAFAEEGKVTMPLEKTYWAEAFGMVIDKFGTSWMVNYDVAK